MTEVMVIEPARAGIFLCPAGCVAADLPVFAFMATPFFYGQVYYYIAKAGNKANGGRANQWNASMP